MKINIFFQGLANQILPNMFWMDAYRINIIRYTYILRQNKQNHPLLITTKLYNYGAYFYGMVPGILT